MEPTCNKKSGFQLHVNIMCKRMYVHTCVGWSSAVCLMQYVLLCVYLSVTFLYVGVII